MLNSPACVFAHCFMTHAPSVSRLDTPSATERQKPTTPIAAAEGASAEEKERVAALHQLHGLLGEIEDDLMASDVRRKSGTPSRASGGSSHLVPV